MRAMSARAGHSRIQTTFDKYGHLLPGVEDGMVEQFDVALRAVMENTGQQRRV